MTKQTNPEAAGTALGANQNQTHPDNPIAAAGQAQAPQVDQGGAR